MPCHELILGDGYAIDTGRAAQRKNQVEIDQLSWKTCVRFAEILLPIPADGPQLKSIRPLNRALRACLASRSAKMGFPPGSNRMAAGARPGPLPLSALVPFPKLTWRPPLEEADEPASFLLKPVLADAAKLTQIPIALCALEDVQVFGSARSSFSGVSTKRLRTPRSRHPMRWDSDSAPDVFLQLFEQARIVFIVALETPKSIHLCFLSSPANAQSA